MALSNKKSKITKKKIRINVKKVPFSKKTKKGSVPLKRTFAKKELLKFGINGIRVIEITDVRINNRECKRVLLEDGTVRTISPEELEIRLSEWK